MERNLLCRGWRFVLLSPVILVLTAASSGCVGLIANIFYNGRMVPPPCDALEEKRVAVICAAESGDFGPNPNASMLARRIGQLLTRHGRKIEVVDYQQIEAWHDEHDTDYIDYVEVGRGVKADIVVAIELETLSLQDNQTLWKGRANYQLRVIDVANKGREVYSPFNPEFTHPRMSGLHTASVSKRDFRNQFIDALANDIAKHFYAHDLNQDIASDTPELSRFE